STRIILTADKPPEEKRGLPHFLGDIFLRVLTIPFRAVRFIYRKIATIPLKHLLLMTAIFIALVTLTLVLFVKLTSQPAFCVTCHYMKPYFASWKQSSHKDVHCTECHFPPGITSVIQGKFTAASMLVNYMTGVYRKSKPWAEISDESCLREGCHETRLLQGRVPFKEGIIFDHTHHLTEDRRGKTLRCTSCHSQIVQGSHMTVTEETCFLCHFKDQPAGARMTSCTWCHQAPTQADSANVLFDHSVMLDREVDCRLCHGEMVRGEGDVPKERCSYCHAEAGKLEQYSETVRIHQIHIAGHKVECNQCHNTITHQSIARTGHIKPDCQSCHIDRHLSQFQLFSGQGALGVDPLPSSMFHAGLGCKACHVLLPSDWEENPELVTTKAGPASCTPCHERAYYQLYEQAKPIFDQRITALQNRIRSIKGHFTQSSQQQIIAQAHHNIELLVHGLPIHNLNYADRILQETNRFLDQLEGKPLPVRTLPDTTSARCLRCHPGQDEVVVKHDEKLFSHRNHVHNVQIGCRTCHIEAQPNHGELRSGSFCMDCHHLAAAVSCEPCHQKQREFYRATGPFAGFEPDIMQQAGLACRDCHEVVGTTVHKPDADTCAGCHEPGNWDDYSEMSNGIRERMEAIQLSLGSIIDPEKRNRATQLLEALQYDGTTGRHNMIAAEAALDEIEMLLTSTR
ncbi:MAG: NapC/NirT family cytochrome c, partial [bacterium]